MPNNNPSKLAHLRKPEWRGSWWKDYYKVRTTMGIGLFTPIEHIEIAGNTLYKVKPDIRFESLPMLSPLYDGFTMRTKFYFVPFRLYIPEARRNRQVPWGDIQNFHFPMFVYQSTSRATGNFNGAFRYAFVGSLLDMLGIAYGDMMTAQSFNNPSYVPIKVDETFIRGAQYCNAFPLIAYFDCWLRGEYNRQDKMIPTILDKIIYNGDSDVYNRVVGYQYLNVDDLINFVDCAAGFVAATNLSSVMVRRAYYNPGDSIQIVVNGDEGLSPTTVPGSAGIAGYSWFTDLVTVDSDGTFGSMSLGDYQNFFMPYIGWDGLRNTTSNVGLLPVTYKGDYLSSWYNAEGIARLEEFVVNNGDNFLSLRKKNADFMIELLAAVSGNSYADYMQFIFDSYLELKDHPIMVGFDEIHFGANEDTTATANSGSGGADVVGAVASKAREYSNKVKPISFKTKEPGLLMVCSSIVPNVVYFQGVDRFMLKTTFNDLWHPQYDSKGFQNINFEEYFNPLAMPINDNEEQQTMGYAYHDAVLSSYVSPYVPLGWEYMRRNSKIKGGMKLDRYATWSLKREFNTVSNDSFVKALKVSNSFSRINFLDGSVSHVFGYDVGDDVVSVTIDLEDYFGNIVSTYVRGAEYNVPFANTDSADNHNFIVNFGFLVSQYQPITHTLITKNI